MEGSSKASVTIVLFVLRTAEAVQNYGALFFFQCRIINGKKGQLLEVFYANFQ